MAIFDVDDELQSGLLALPSILAPKISEEINEAAIKKLIQEAINSVINDVGVRFLECSEKIDD